MKDLCLSPYKVALESTTVCDHKKLCWPLSTCRVLQEDQSCDCTAEISRKTHHLDQKTVSRRDGVKISGATSIQFFLKEGVKTIITL